MVDSGVVLESQRHQGILFSHMEVSTQALAHGHKSGKNIPFAQGSVLSCGLVSRDYLY